MAREVNVNCTSVAIFAILLLTQNLGCGEAKGFWTSSRKSNSGSSNRYVAKSYLTQSNGGNSHPQSAAGSGATNTQPIGWNVPKSQGSPTSGTNVYTPITATKTHGVQISYPGAIYNSRGSVPAGATHYSPGYVPVVLHPSPPHQTSSGLGFGSGLAIGALGGAILHQGLTKTQTRVESPQGSADDKIFIINNGPPGSVTTTNAAGATVITTGVVGENATKPMPAPGVAPAQLPPGGIICVRVPNNDTDPADSSKMIKVEKMICDPAPRRPPAPVAGASVKTSGAGAWLNYAACNSMTIVLLSLFVAFFGLH